MSDAGQDDYVQFIQSLIEDLAGTSVSRLDIRQGDLRIGLRREVNVGVGGQAYADVMQVTESAPVRPVHWHAVTAPLTGIFYSRPSPSEEPYVSVDGHVELEQVIGLIESMKMFNEITAEVAGMVREVHFDNGALVEAGQAILYIEQGEGSVVEIIRH